jgi:hypothetical protein
VIDHNDESKDEASPEVQRMLYKIMSVWVFQHRFILL